MPADYQYDEDNMKLRINCLGYIYGASIEDYAECMARAIDSVLEVKKVASLILMKEREYEYDYEQTRMLAEIASILDFIIKENLAAKAGMLLRKCGWAYPDWNARLQYILFELLRKDPIGSYVEMLREMRYIKVRMKSSTSREACTALHKYATEVLAPVKDRLEASKLITLAGSRVSGYHVGDRSVYRQIFLPLVRPNFMLTRYMIMPPKGGKSMERYNVGDAQVEIYRLPNTAECLYHILPPEFRLPDGKYAVLDQARFYMATHQPKTVEFVRSKHIRDVFFNIGKDMLRDVAEKNGAHMTAAELEQLAAILTRYTAGLGVLEILMNDQRVQDIFVNSPIERQPIMIFHSDFEECRTNLIPTHEDAEAWATRLRMESGRPLDEANPVLDAEISVPGGRARFAVITRSLSPEGLGFAVRRHRDRPWTLPLFIKSGMLDPLAAGLLSFLVDGSVSMLVAGGRGAGKCLEGSELVQMANGELREIKSIVDGCLAQNGSKDCGDGVYSPVNGPEIMTLNNEMKITPAKVSHVWKRKAHPENITITTKSGRTITCTPEHPFFVPRDLGVGQVRADELMTGQHIAAPRTLDTRPAGTSLPCFDQPKRAVNINIPREVTPELMEFLGYVYGDGHITKPCHGKSVVFTNNTPVLQERFKMLASGLFGIMNVRRRVDKRSDTVSHFIHSASLASYLTGILSVPCGKKADIICIPPGLLSLPKDRTASLVRALFDCDSSVNKDKREIEYSTASRKLALQLQSILSRFDVFSFLRVRHVKARSYYRLIIRGDEMAKYTAYIGFNHPGKYELAQKISASCRSNTNIDVVPVDGSAIKELRLALGIQNWGELRSKLAENMNNLEKGKWLPTRQKLMRIANIFEGKYAEIESYRSCISDAKRLGFAIRNSYRLAAAATMLGISETEIARASGASRHSVAGFAGKSCRPSAFMRIACVLPEIIRRRISEFESVKSACISAGNMASCIEKTGLTYAHLSGMTSIPQASLKGYAYGGASIPPMRAQSICYALSTHMALRGCAVLQAQEAVLNVTCPCLLGLETVWSGVLSFLDSVHSLSKEIAKHCGLSVSMIEGLRDGKYSPGLVTLEKVLEFAVARFHGAVVSKAGICQLGKMANSDIFWDKVTSVGSVKPKDEWVYDLTVDDTHSFVASGLVAHNTSILAALMLELLPKIRICTIEDTLELPARQLRDLGYNIESLKSRSVITRVETEMPAEEALRTALRLGDSAMIVGEVRSSEARSLYEAMRIGALSNVVAGTIHGESAYGVYDRVVNDLGVPPTSFKATDIIPICKTLRSADGMHRFRRMTEITEVRKSWETNPMKEGGFVNLMEYSGKLDRLKPTDTLVNGESEVLNRIASYVKEWSGDWSAVWENIQTRAKMKQSIVEMSDRLKRPELLEAEWVTLSNSKYHMIVEQLRKEGGAAEASQVYEQWMQWIKQAVRGGY